MTGRPKCLISTVVWGDRHVGAFLDLNVPTLLAEGNLPAFAARIDTIYVIHTPRADRQRMRRSCTFQRLQTLIDLRFEGDFSGRDISDPIQTHQAVWWESINAARRERRFIMLMPPDVVWSDGSLRHLAGLIEAGKKAIIVSWHLRAIGESFVPEFLNRYRGRTPTIAVPGRDLVRLTLEHVHPISAASRRASTAMPYHPEMIFWPVRGQGVIMHSLAMTPFLFDPGSVWLTSQKLIAGIDDPRKLHVVDDSDDVYAVSLAEVTKDSTWYHRNQRVDPVEIARWWMRYDSPVNDAVVIKPVRLRFDRSDEAAWRREEQSARLFVRRITQARELFRIFCVAKRLGCTNAAALIAAALYMGIAAYVMRNPEPVTVFLPDDEASRMAWVSVLDGLVDPTMRRALIRFFRSHMVRTSRLPPDLKVPPGLITRVLSENQEALTITHGDQITVNDVPVIGPFKGAGNNTVYVAAGFITRPVTSIMARTLGWQCTA